MNPDTNCTLECGHRQDRYNNLRSDPVGWMTWCYPCGRERRVVKSSWPTQETDPG